MGANKLMWCFLVLASTLVRRGPVGIGPWSLDCTDEDFIGTGLECHA